MVLATWRFDQARPGQVPEADTGRIGLERPELGNGVTIGGDHQTLAGSGPTKDRRHLVAELTNTNGDR